ncbi:MAG TPA: hypothetical protein VGK38_01080, partial [Prolixibacteraceae bacterium]
FEFAQNVGEPFVKIYSLVKAVVFFLLFMCISMNIFGQTSEVVLKGTISYITSQNVYVKFDNTEGIHVGDTLFIARNNVLIPVLTVNNISTISVVGTPVGEVTLSISTPVFGRVKVEKKPEKPITKESKEPVGANLNDQAIKSFVQENKSNESKSRFDGRLALSSYSTFSNSTSDMRYRYNLSLNAQHIDNSKFSAESYISFTHKSNELGQVGQDINKYLKIYTLAVKYDLSKSTNISFGRKINMNMANIGAVDGLQFETGHRNFTYGAVAGSRPDYYNYSFNPDLMQFGVFAGYNIQTENGYMQTSVAVFDQMNKFKTDRRFAYIQNSNSLLDKVDLFCSFEFDFYTLKNLQPTNTIDLTSTYISIRYKPAKNLSLLVSYDARKNVYYYETFKNQIDSIIDRETRQGIRFNFNYRPVKYLSWGGSAGYRFQKSDPVPSINANSYLNYSQVPFILTSSTINATLLRTNYIDGMVYGISLARDILSGEIYSELQYRHVKYTYKSSHIRQRQNIGELSLSWRMAKKLMLTADYEATYEKGNNMGRIYLNLTKRF